MKRTANIQRRMATLLLALVLAVGCSKRPQVTPATDGAATPAVSMQTGRTIDALGTVRPAQTLQQSFGTGGPIETVSVRPGTAVQAGDLLAKLDTTALYLDLENARAQVTIQQAALDALLDGPSQAEIERARAAHAQQVARAESALRLAQLDLEQAALSGPGTGVTLVQAERAQLELQQAQARAGSPQANVTVARVELARTQDALDTAQDAYKQALDRPWEPQEGRDALAQDVQQARWDVQTAQARLEAAQSAQRVHALGLDLLVARGDTVQAQLEQALDARAAYAVTLAQLAVRVEQAQQDLDALTVWTNPLLDPAPPEAIAQARARLRQAELAVDQVRWHVAGAEIRAPFDGVISAVYAHPGEWAAAGMPALQVIDTTRWTVETRSVSELSIGQIQIGQDAEVQILALENQVVRGRVASISPVAVVQQGDTTYTLLIALEPTDLALWSGMNAQVHVRIE